MKRKLIIFITLLFISFNVTSQETKEGIVAINWDWKDYNKDKDLVGFIVLKAISPEGPFDTLSNGYIPEETKKLLDQNQTQQQGVIKK